MWDLVGIVDGTYIPELCAKDPTGTETVELLDPDRKLLRYPRYICQTYCRDPGTTGKELYICAWERRYGITLTITDAPELYDDISVMKNDTVWASYGIGVRLGASSCRCQA